MFKGYMIGMTLINLSLAVFLILSLVGCGGSDDSLTIHNSDGSDTVCHTWEYHGTHTECRTFQ